MSSLVLKSPSKINLQLHILGKRKDGYHNLSMLMEKISLCDEIILEKINTGIEIEMQGTNIPLEKNLCFRAAAALKEVAGISCGVRLRCDKKIPMGGGLGGGSGNAATVLKGLNQLWNLNWPVEKLAQIGVKLGADVPFFLHEGPAIVEGIGDQITPLRNLPKLWIILINPGVSISTPWAYAAWDQNQLTQENQSVTTPPTFATFAEVAANLRNDFEAIVFPRYPEIAKAKEVLLQSGAKGALMSGSGSSVFGLFETVAARDKAVRKMNVPTGWQVFAVENGG